jgi:site-specific DNA-cytosine methylase
LGVSTTGGFGSAMKDTSPCLLSSHKYYYSTKKKRFMTVPEWASLQGFDPSILDPTLLSYKQLGNTMSVNVLAFVFQNIFNSVKF